MDKFVATDPHLIRREDSFLVVVDVQEKLAHTIAGVENMTREIARLIRFAEIIDLPILHAEQIKLGSTIAELSAPLGERKPVKKDTFGCFGHPEFVKKVEGLDRSTLIVAGIETHVCVLQTTMGALQRGYRVQVVADAVGSRDPANKEIALKRMAAAGAEITCGESVLFELMVKAGTDEFRTVLPLLK